MAPVDVPVNAPSTPQGFYDALLDDDPEDLYQHAPVGYLSTTPTGAIVKVNQTFLDWVGMRREDLVGRRSFVDLLSPGGKLYHETHYAPMLAMQGHAREIALDIVTADRGRLPVLVNAVLRRDEAGTPRVVRIAVFDASERRAYERELLRAKERAESSEARARELARTLQQTLLPPALPVVPGLDLGAVFRPAGAGTEIGGDFYDVFQLGVDDWVVVLGDVCGKGVQAALVTSLVRHTLRTVVIGLHAPSNALDVLNEVLLQHETERFCTVVMARLRRRGPSWHATLSSGGHPHGLVVDPGGSIADCGGTGPLVGLFEDASFTDEEVTLGPGTCLVLFTDGVTEARRGDEQYGDERLRACLQRSRGSAQQRAETVLADALAFQPGSPRDDVAVLAMCVPEQSTTPAQAIAN